MIRLSLRLLILLVSCIAIASFGLSAARHVMRPSSSDPVERAILERSRRIAHHEPLYVDATMAGDLSPMPGVPYAVSLLALDQKPELWHVRSLALAAVFLTAFLVAVFVRLETSSWTLAVASGSFALIGQGFLAGLPGTARPEIIMLPLVLIGLSLIRYTDGIWGALIAAVPLAGAFFVDPQAAWFVGAAYFSVALETRARLATFAIAAGLLLGGGYLALSFQFGPWFNFSVWDQNVALLRFSPTHALRYVSGYLLGMLQVWTLAALLAHAMPTQPWQGKCGIWMCMGVAAVLAGIVSTQSSAFGPHSLVVGVVVLSLLGPIIVQRIARHLSAWIDPDLPGGEGVVLAALLLQFFVFLSALPQEYWVQSVRGLWHLMV